MRIVKNYYKFRIFSIILLSISFNLYSVSQTFEPGISYSDSTGFIEFIAGNVPIIISAPHGGYLEPDSIPDCPDCSTIRDAYTQEIARGISETYFNKTGCYPNIIINLLHRRKLDANRDIEEATGGTPILESAWFSYHDFIDSAKINIEQNFGKGLFLDLHGHAHEIQRIEMGYLLSKSELQMTNQEINTSEIVDESSIHELANSNLQSLSHAELLRGEYSLGTLMDQKGFPSVPSSSDLFPLDNEPYFTGGYNTRRHGSISQGTIDAVQFEFNQSVRFDSNTRKMLIDSLVSSIIEYVDYHYYDNFSEIQCNVISNTSEIESKKLIRIYPNPSNEVINITGLNQFSEVLIFDIFGKQVGSHKWVGNPLNVNYLDFGNYLIIIKNDQLFKTFKFLKIN